ncbi:MAG: glycosyltransferase family 39 protein [Deltaproteobacteria bacterium]
MRRCGLAVLAAAFGVRALVASPPVLHDWDERYHALVAKGLVTHPLTPVLLTDGLGRPGDGWTTTRIFLHKPPLALWVMALGRWALGPSEWALRAGSVLLGTATVALTLALGAELLVPPAALLFAALAVAFAPELLWLTSGGKATDQVDVQLAFWVTASALALWRTARWQDASAIGLAALALAGGLLTKSWPALAAVPAALTVARGRRGLLSVGLACAGAVALALPWQLYARAHWPGVAAAEQAYALRHFGEPLEGHGGSPLLYLVELLRWFGPVALLSLLATLPALWRPGRERSRFLLLWALVPLAIFSAAATKMTGYLAPELPALALLSAAVASHWLRAARSNGPRLAAGALLLSVFGWPLAASALSLRRMLAIPAGYTAFRERAGQLAAPDVVFNLRWAPQAMVYSPATATETWPTADSIAAVRASGLHALLAACPGTPDAGVARWELSAGCAR